MEEDKKVLDKDNVLKTDSESNNQANRSYSAFSEILSKIGIITFLSPFLLVPLLLLYKLFGIYFVTLAMMILAFLIIWFIPEIQIKRLREKTINETQSEFDKERDILKLTDDLRKTMAQIIGGVVLVFSLGAAYYTYQLTKERMYSDRYSEAIKLLKKDNEMSIRLGGLFELDSIFNESERFRPAIIKVLMNYVKERSLEISDFNECKIKNDKDGNIKSNDDILVATNIILERTKSDVLDFNIDFSNAMLNNGKFNSADFSKVTSFENTCFVDAKLRFANLRGEKNFTKTQFLNADLTNANFKDSNLSKALNIKKEYIYEINTNTQVSAELQETREERLLQIEREKQLPPGDRISRP